METVTPTEAVVSRGAEQPKPPYDRGGFTRSQAVDVAPSAFIRW